MSAEVLPVPPAPAGDQTPAPSLGAEILAGIADGVGGLTAVQNANLSAFIGGILQPIVRQEVQDAFKLFKDKAVLSKGNDALQNLDRL